MRALLLGNSQIVCNCNLPEIVRALAASAPQAALELDQVVIGGATIEKLWNDGRAAAAIKASKWDWVLCHEIVYSYGGNGVRLREFGRKFHELATQNGARMVFYASGDVEHQKATHEPMYCDALELARECGGRVAGGGAAWLKAWEERPELDFHCSDRAHASDLGYYLNACVIFATLTGVSPLGRSPWQLQPEDAQFLQRIAWKQYSDDRRNEATSEASLR